MRRAALVLGLLLLVAAPAAAKFGWLHWGLDINDDLPTCDAGIKGRPFWVVDGASATDCSTGGGSTVVVCTCDGSSYVGAAPSGSDGVGYDEVLDEGSGVTKRAQVNFIGAGVSCVDNAGNTRTDCTISGGGGGSAITLDLGDDGGNDSTDLTEIATTGDTNSIFTEPSADKLLIAVGNDWPKADDADEVTCTGCVADSELASTFLKNVVEDTTPQLGGDLDGDGNDIDDSGVLFQREQADADADVAGQGQWWTNTATPNEPYFTGDGGNDWALVGTDETQTLTNKTINTASNTLTVVEADISDLSHTTEVNDLSAAVTWANVPDANVAGSDERDEVCGTTDLSSSCEINADVVDFADINQGNTLAGNPALLVDECFFAKTATGGCFICEGSTADTNEQLYCFQDLNGADTTSVIVTEAGTQTLTNKSLTEAQISDLSHVLATAAISDVSVTQTEFAELETIGATTISAAQWAGLGGATTAGLALWDDANAAAQLVTLGLTATASEINTPLDGASVTLTEFQELEAIGATTISANQWAALGGIAETLTSTELDLLDGITVLSGSNTGDVTLAGTPDYITLSGQVLTRGTVDIGDDTNLAAGTGLTLTGDSLSNDLGTAIESTEIATIVQTDKFNAGFFNSDGTQCADAAEVTIGSWGKTWAVICTDNDASTVTFTYPTPDGWDAGTVVVKLFVVQDAADTSAFQGDVACRCVGDTETPAAYGTEQALDDTMTGSDALNVMTSAAVTAAGTCAAADLLQCQIQVDATGTTTAMATLNILGGAVEWTSNVGD